MSKFIVCFQIKPVEYMELISSLRPNLWATLADEVPTWASEKRNKTSVDRTIKWLDECIALSPVRTIRVCVCVCVRVSTPFLVLISIII